MSGSVGARPGDGYTLSVKSLLKKLNNHPTDPRSIMPSESIESLWAHLHWLTVLADQGSYTAAAGRLGVSKAAVSLKIAELERAAGVPLVQRTTRSVRLTEAGRHLVDETRPLYDRIAQSFSGVRDTAEVVRGSLRVSAPVALARQQLVPRLAEFRRRHPEVRIQLDVSDRLVSLATEGYDLAIRHSASAPETHVAWQLCRTVSLLVATPAYLAARGRPGHPDELAGHDCLFYPRSHDSAAWTFERAGTRRQRAARVTVPIAGPFCANNSEVLRDAALDDLGHRAAARFLCGGRAAGRHAGARAARVAAGGRVRRAVAGGAALRDACAARGDGLRGLSARGFRGRVRRGGRGRLSVAPDQENCVPTASRIGCVS